MVTLSPEQQEAVDKLGNGKILVGGTGSGKSLTGLSYYLIKVCGYHWENNTPVVSTPVDLYIITTAKKRDSLEWEEELLKYNVGYFESIHVKIDSWNNLHKYVDITNAFFILDEQHLTGYGAWCKAFLKIAKQNRWILLTATPGDTWLEYMPIFIANGFYKNKTEFTIRHVIYSRYTKYPSVERWINEGLLFRHKNDILVVMQYTSKAEKIREDIYCQYDMVAYKSLFKERWNPYEDRPIRNISELCYLLRRTTYSSACRLEETKRLIDIHKKVIIFYNFDFELENLIAACEDKGYHYAQCNGHKHEKLPEGDSWVYLVNYGSGAEAWNCITCDTIIFFSLSYSYKTMTQAEGRIDRRNSPYNRLYYFYLKSRSSIDIAVSRALNRKQDFNERNLKIEFTPISEQKEPKIA